MLGAEALLRTLASSGVTTCFANPGTSEMHLVAALDAVPSMRPVLTLAEGVASGAADGWARVTGRPAATLLHLGPGLSNALSNLHNAKRAQSPVVNIVGDHASYHRASDAPLTSDIAGLARTVSAWVGCAAGADDMSRAAGAALRAAMGPPGAIATLIVPADAAWGETTQPVENVAPAAPRVPNAHRVEAVRRALASGASAVLLIGGAAMRGSAVRDASRAANAAKARLFSTTFTAVAERGAGRVLVNRLPYFPEQVVEALAGTRYLVLAGASVPVAFFAYPGLPGALVPDGCEVLTLAEPEEDVAAALGALAAALGAPENGATMTPHAPPPLPTGRLDPSSFAQALGALLPEGAIVSDEAVTTRFPALAATVGSASHDWLCLTGGSLGLGMPMALGAALAAPDRPVITLEADGSAMYAPQALWSFAREGANVTTLVLKNRRYRILEVELERLQLTDARRGRELLNLSAPEVDFVALARSMGVPGVRATTVEEVVVAMRRAFAEDGPSVVEVVLEG